MSRISIYMQNFPQGVSFPRMREIAHQRCLLGFFFCPGSSKGPAQAPEPIFTRNTSNDAVPRKDVPFQG